MQDSPPVLSMGRLCSELGYSADRRNSQKTNGTRVIECNIEKFVPIVAENKPKAVQSIEFSTAKGNLKREQEVGDTMLDLSQPLTEGLQERNTSSSTPKAEG